MPNGIDVIDVHFARVRSGNPAAGMAMGMIAITAALLSIIVARQLVGRHS
jgi:hypothetical protein